MLGSLENIEMNGRYVFMNTSCSGCLLQEGALPSPNLCNQGLAPCTVQG